MFLHFEPFVKCFFERKEGISVNLDFTSVAAITAICYLAAEITKSTRIHNKWIPVICGILGAILGVVGMVVMASFPADDYFNAIAIGIVSGLSATGVHQVAKQMSTRN